MKIKRFEFNMFSVNTYLVWDETKEAAIIDAGCYFPEEQTLLDEYIRANELQVKLLLNTHFHLDHVFGNPFVLRKYGLSTHGHRADEFLLDNLSEQCTMFGFKPNEPTVPIGTYIDEGDILRFGNTELRAIHVPGHSPGSLVFHSEKDACAFVGDVLFHGSIGRTDLAGGDFNLLRKGITEKLFPLPDETKIYSGHGESTTIGNEKSHNPFFR